LVATGPTTGNNYEWVEELYARGAGGSFDAVSVHTDTACLVNGPDVFYRDAGRIARFTFLGYRSVHEVMAAHGDASKPIWMSELGWSSTGGGPRSCARGVWAGQKPSGVSASGPGPAPGQGVRVPGQRSVRDRGGVVHPARSPDPGRRAQPLRARDSQRSSEGVAGRGNRSTATVEVHKVRSLAMTLASHVRLRSTAVQRDGSRYRLSGIVVPGEGEPAGASIHGKVRIRWQRLHKGAVFGPVPVKAAV
jgi:hypothetical protein